MAIGEGVIGGAMPIYEKQKKQDRDRVKVGLQRIREALISDAKMTASRGSGLPKDWRNRVFK